MSFSTEDWEEKIKNPDPRIKWAMDVMDQEGQDFEGALGRVWSPISATALPLMGNLMRNATNRVPLRTNFIFALALCPAFMFGGYHYRYKAMNAVQMTFIICYIQCISGNTLTMSARRMRL